jgi:hypothetical protein
MSIDEMLWALTDVDSITGKVRISKEAARAIGEALKAGHAMRISLQAVIDHPANNIVAYGSCDSWDEATKEEV